MTPPPHPAPPLPRHHCRYAGVFEAVKIRKMGYPFRLEHHEFAATYRWIARKANGWAPIQAHPQAAPAQYVAAVLASVHQDFSKVHIGRTLCLYRADDVELTSCCHPCPPVTTDCRYRYRADEHRVLELLKNLALGRIFQQMQASFRRKMGRHVTPCLTPRIPHICRRRSAGRWAACTASCCGRRSTRWARRSPT